MSNTDPINTSGLTIATTEPIRSFLFSASTDSSLTQESRATALSLLSESTVSYKSIRSLWTASHSSLRPGLMKLFSGSEFVFNAPKPREKSAELKERLRKLAEMEERREYKELVKDITPPTNTAEPFSSYKDQLGFGMHVAITMFAGYLVGYAAFRALFNHNVAMSAAGGILGMVGAMLVETLLFIIRSSNLDRKSSPSASSSSKMKKSQ